MKNLIRHLISFTAPVVMCLVLPYLIIRWESQSFSRPMLTTSSGLLLLGGVICAAGFTLFILAVRMFILIGNGTIMPWDPTRKLIVSSLYAHMRNPMILAVISIQVGEAVLFASEGIAWLIVAFFVINTLYFIASEEPGLEKRFGEEYAEYKRNVPRWFPRLKPWKPI